MIDRWECGYCGAISTEDELLTAPNPFDPSDDVTGCPICKTAADFTPICDVPTCRAVVSCGTPTRDGYRNTCGKHRPEMP